MPVPDRRRRLSYVKGKASGDPCPGSRRMLTSAARMAERRQHPSERRACGHRSALADWSYEASVRRRGTGRPKPGWASQRKSAGAAPPATLLGMDRNERSLTTPLERLPGVGTPRAKRLILRAAAVLSPSSRRLQLTDAHNGLRVFNRTVADQLNLSMSGMSHAGEFIKLIDENRWRVDEQPVEILYTDYSLSKGQPLLNGVNIVFDGFLRGRMRR